MNAAIKAEFRKLLTVRSTYILALLSVLIVIFFAFYIEGLRASEPIAAAGKLAGEVTAAIGAIVIIPAIVGLLLLANEYRYNTINYTLTAARSRTQVLLAKILVVSVFAFIFTLFIGALSPTMTYLGLQIKGVAMEPQVFPVWDLLWRSLFFTWGYCMIALMVTTIIRNQLFAIVFLFFVPGTIEALLSLLLKENTAYLPFTALRYVIDSGPITHTKAALVFSIYLVVGWLVAWYLFRRRDAN